jgi:hypothetical protein
MLTFAKTNPTTMNTEMWSKSTKAIFNGVLLFSIGGVLLPIINFADGLANAKLYAAIKMAKAFGSGSAIPFADRVTGLAVFGWILLAVIIFGYYLYLKGLTEFETAVEPSDSENVKKIKTATILVLVGMGVIFLFGILGIGMGKFIGGCLNIVAYILMLLAYSALKSSSTFPEAARAGANMLFISMILLLCAVVLGWIPFIGGILSIIVSVIAFFMVFTGWSKIKNAVTA